MSLRARALSQKHAAPRHKNCTQDPHASPPGCDGPCGSQVEAGALFTPNTKNSGLIRLQYRSLIVVWAGMIEPNQTMTRPDDSA